jgi:hypothetical protein
MSWRRKFATAIREVRSLPSFISDSLFVLRWVLITFLKWVSDEPSHQPVLTCPSRWQHTDHRSLPFLTGSCSSTASWGNPPAIDLVSLSITRLDEHQVGVEATSLSPANARWSLPKLNLTVTSALHRCTATHHQVGANRFQHGSQVGVEDRDVARLSQNLQIPITNGQSATNRFGAVCGKLGQLTAAIAPQVGVGGTTTLLNCWGRNPR